MNRDDAKSRFFARTMHTPDDESRAARRAALRETSKILIPLHRALIDAAKEEYVFAHGPVDQPIQLLRLLNEDPFFEWLKPITALIVDIDEMSRRDFDTADSVAIADRVEALFGSRQSPEFAKHYVPALQRSVDVAIGHAALRKVVPNLR
jgi:hypothetical protein